jgi:hypothetical protein
MSRIAPQSVHELVQQYVGREKRRVDAFQLVVQRAIDQRVVSADRAAVTSYDRLPTLLASSRPLHCRL